MTQNRRRGLLVAAIFLSVAFGLTVGQQLFRIVIDCVAPKGTGVTDYVAESLASGRMPDIVWCVSAIWVATALTGITAAFAATLLVRLRPGSRAILASCTSLYMAIIFGPLTGVFAPMSFVTGSAVAAAGCVALALCVPAWTERVSAAYVKLGQTSA